ncbi:MAG: magnesium/cobalt transporter CorA [Thermomicrobiales bacterium]|nr:magnesium/cobalt transporter CorA [Thermomicrobiales bacterium]
MINVNVHSHGNVLENSLPIDQISDVLDRPGELLWIDVHDPTNDDIRSVVEEFNFHPLAIEDVVRQRQRPKVDIYNGYVLIIFYGLAATSDDEGTPILTQVGIFVGSNYVVTIHDAVVPALKETSDRWCRNVEQLGSNNISLLLYSILDAIVDAYFPVLDELSDRLEELEERIFDRADPRTQHEIFHIKKQLVTMRKHIAPERDAMNVLLRRDTPILDPSIIPYFQDVYDHIIRVTDAIDTFRDLLSSALDFQLAVTSNRLNQIMKTLTASSIILMGMTLVASIYGMNFEHMPELGWHFGYLWALGLMAVIGGSLITLFRRIDWL